METTSEGLAATLLADVPPLLTRAEVARVFRVSRKTVCRWTEDGRLAVARAERGGSSRALYPKPSVVALLDDMLQRGRVG